jgi:ribose 5-phosphate isomerase B
MPYVPLIRKTKGSLLYPPENVKDGKEIFVYDVSKIVLSPMNLSSSIRSILSASLVIISNICHSASIEKTGEFSPMRIAISSDEYDPLLDVLSAEIEKRGHSTLYFGPKSGEKAQDWPEVTLQAIREIEAKRADEAIILCWTGTGCSIVANKIPGIRAALCIDAETAKGARLWNHANVLALSLRLISAPVLKEILAAWFDTPLSTDAWNLQQIERVKRLEDRSMVAN